MKIQNIIGLKNEYQSNFEKICDLESELAVLLITNEKIKKILVKLGEMEDSDSDSSSFVLMSTPTKSSPPDSPKLVESQPLLHSSPAIIEPTIPINIPPRPKPKIKNYL